MATEASIVKRMQGVLTALENRFSGLFTLLDIGDIPKLKKSGTGGVLKRLMVLLRRIERVETMLNALRENIDFGDPKLPESAFLRWSEKENQMSAKQREYIYQICVYEVPKLQAAEEAGYKNPERAVKSLDKNAKVQEAIARRM